MVTVHALRGYRDDGQVQAVGRSCGAASEKLKNEMLSICQGSAPVESSQESVKKADIKAFFGRFS
jgi:hypothetical protein